MTTVRTWKPRLVPVPDCASLGGHKFVNVVPVTKRNRDGFGNLLALYYCERDGCFYADWKLDSYATPQGDSGSTRSKVPLRLFERNPWRRDD